jgi:hypothetical protein
MNKTEQPPATSPLGHPSSLSSLFPQVFVNEKQLMSWRNIKNQLNQPCQIRY